MYFSSTALVAVLPALGVAHLCAHHGIQPPVLVVETQNRIPPTYEAPQIKIDTQDHANHANHVHVVTKTITQTTHATTTLTSTTLPPLLPPSSISLYTTISPTSSESMEYHEDLKIKRDQTPTPPMETHTPMFTGHGPVQTGFTSSIQGQSVTMVNGTMTKATGTASASVSASKAASASASKATSSSGAGVVSVGYLGAWGTIMVLVGLM